MWNKKKKKREDENMLRNGGLLLEKRISYFNGKYSNPIRTFSAKELQEATNNYNPKRISGFGSCYKWYKGCLEGRVIFVKKYFSDYGPLADPERVSNGIAVAAQVSGHKNALKLLGCCLQTPEPTLVFEFPMNGNLLEKLETNPASLSWKFRLKIANEIASVITYLHTAFPRPIIHRDIHGRQFYLDQDFSAKLCDFILCMALPEGETQVDNEPIMGTCGFAALEVVSSGVYSEKSDVFGFGSILFNLLTGKRYGGIEIESNEYYTRSYIRNHTMNDIVDPTILAEAEAAGGGEGVHHHHHHQFQAVIELILRCLSDNADERPIMLDVAKQLKRIQRYYRP